MPYRLLTCLLAYLHRLMMSGKDFLKSHVLSWRRKVYSDWEDVTPSDRAFQVFGPATGKARLPSTDGWSLDRWHQKTIGACRTKRPSAGKTAYWHERPRCGGALTCRTL